MSDRDNITLPREVAYQVPLHELLESVPLDARLVIDYADGRGTAFIPVGRYCHEAATALRTALADEPTKQEPGLTELARQMKPLDADMAAILHDNLDSLYIEDEPALAAETPRHPGYIIGNHWFETAYERLCAGEAEDAILEDYELVREPRLRDLRRDAERYRWLRENTRVWPSNKAVWEGNQIGAAAIWIKQSVDWTDDASIDAAIDAAMGASTAPASAAADASTAPEDKT